MIKKFNEKLIVTTTDSEQIIPELIKYFNDHPNEEENIDDFLVKVVCPFISINDAAGIFAAVRKVLIPNEDILIMIDDDDYDLENYTLGTESRV